MSYYSEKGVSDNFDSGASYLISEANYDRYVNGGGSYLGRPDENGNQQLFCAPKNEMDKMLEEHPNDPREWERQLSLPENSLSDDVMRVNIDNPKDYGLKSPQAKTPGANDQYVDTNGSGKIAHTKGGMSEGVLENAENPTKKEGIGSTEKVCESQNVNKAESPQEKQSNQSGQKNIKPQQKNNEGEIEQAEKQKSHKPQQTDGLDNKQLKEDGHGQGTYEKAPASSQPQASSSERNDPVKEQNGKASSQEKSDGQGAGSGSSGMSVKAANTGNSDSGTEKGASSGMATTNVSGNAENAKGSSSGMSTTSAGQNDSAPEPASEKSHNSGRSM